MMKNLVYLFALFLTVKAHTHGARKIPSTIPATKPEAVKVTPKNVSALYIGDLLRTKPKEVLEAAGSVHQPIISNRGFLSQVHAKPVAARSYNYKSHGGHEYRETEFLHPSTESRSSLSSHAKGLGTSARVVPLMGHLLTLKPVRVVPTDAYPRARNAGTHQKADHYSNDDCSKSGEHSYSSEDKSYVPEQKTYRRAKQVEPEYRSPQSSYDEDDRSQAYSSHSDPSTGSHHSKSYATDTNTKSQSSGSYTKSKSTSSSRTEIPNRPTQRARITPTTVSHAPNYEKDLGPTYGNQDIIVYKVREPLTNRRPSSFSESTGDEYSAPNYETEYKADVKSPYSQYPPEEKKLAKQSHRVRGHHSNSEQDAPKQYGPASYEQDKASYVPSSYGQPEEQRYREQNTPTSAYQQEPQYTPHSGLRGQEPQNIPYQGYQNPGSGRQYEAEDKKSHSRKRHRKPAYESISHDGREDSRYRTREPSTQGYDYSSEQPIQSSRPRNLEGYTSYSSQEPHTESGSSQTYDRNQPTLRPSEEKEMNQYAYEPTPHQVNNKQNSRTHRKQYQESLRSVRSPDKYAKSVIVDGRKQLPVGGNEQLIMVSRESKPYVSHSVSNSQSGFHADGNPTTESNNYYRDTKERSQLQGNPTTEGRQSSGFDPAYPTAYKPFNSEYPASYANDPHNRNQGQYHSRDYEAPQQPYEQPNSYEENPSQYHPYEEQQRPYEQGHHDDNSYEENEAPAKKNKDHHYISKVEGYKDEYSSSTPLHLDDAFFEKYGISKSAKIIVAEAMEPNLFVADGTKVGEGGHSESSGHYEEERFEPNHNEDFEQDSYSESPEPLGVPRQIPGNFDDLVKANPRILRKLPQIMSPVDAIFKLQDADASYDDSDFRNAEQKGFIVSQGPREIVQQHGDGVSRILFNVPKGEGRAASSNEQDYKEENRRKDEERIVEAASAVLENIIKSES